MQVLNKVRDFLSEHSIRNSSTLVALSGGTDSTALLHLLLELKEEFDLELSIAHLDHCLRGDSSRKDAQFVKTKAEELGLEVTVDKRQVKRLADEESRSLEEAARKVRYEFLSETADEQGSDYIALGHNRNDMAETVLMNILRGTGLRGLRGMRDIKGRYIRPLLEVPRDEIKSYIQSRKLDYRRDETNKDTGFLRNRIRHELIPDLEDNYHSGVVENITRMAKLAKEAHSFVKTQANEVYREVRVPRDVDGICFDRTKLPELHTYLQKATIRKLIEETKGDLQDVTSDHVNQVVSKIIEEPARARLSLPGITFKLTRQKACFVRQYQGQGQVGFQYKIRPGETLVVEEAGTRISLELESNPQQIKPEDHISDSLTELVDWGKVEQPIVVRNRVDGDRFVPLGMTGKKKVKDFFIDEKVPYERRDSIPLICDRKGIIWVVGFRIDDRYKVKETTDEIITMRAREI